MGEDGKMGGGRLSKKGIRLSIPSGVFKRAGADLLKGPRISISVLWMEIATVTFDPKKGVFEYLKDPNRTNRAYCKKMCLTLW